MPASPSTGPEGEPAPAGNGPPTTDAPASASEDESVTPSFLLDGAAGPPDVDPREIAPLREVASDASRPLVERLDAYEDLIASEVGDTSLARARNLERETGLRQLYLKFEGGNPTGTQKDRIAFAQVHDALRRGFEAITIASCGNYGAAMAFAASLAGLRCVVYIPDTYRTRRLGEIEPFASEVVRNAGDYEAAVDASRERAERDELYDANPGGANTAIQLAAYAEIAREIYDELRDAPAAVALPVSNGTTLAGVHRGFVSLWRRGRTSRVPRIVAGSSHGKNPIVQSFLRGWEECRDLDPARVRETAVNEPLINWHSSDGHHALGALRSTGGWADDASDREMLAHARRLREREGLSVLPASTAGLVVLLARQAREPLPGDRYVAVLTGRR